MEKARYCFFIIGCKKNVSLLEFQLATLKKASNNSIEIFVSLDEEVDLQIEGVVFLCGNKEDIFGDRVCNAARMAPYKYIIVMCDDFIVEKQINKNELDILVRQFYLDSKISSIALASVSGKNKREYLQLDEYKDKYIKRDKFAIFKTTLQCAIWNKNAFIYLMRGVRNPWEFEVYQNFKTYTSINTFYAIKNDLNQPIVYNRGRLIIRGRIVEPERKRLENVLNTKIELLGYEKTYSYLQKDNLNIWQKIFRRIRLYFEHFYYRFLSTIKKQDINKEIETIINTRTKE